MKNSIRLIIGVLIIGVSIGCSKDNNCISGTGSNTSRNYTVSVFNGISVSGEADVYVTKDSINSLRIEGQGNVLDVLNVNVNSGVLSIGDNNCFNNINRLKIYVGTPSLTEVATSGTCSVYSNDSFTESGFDASISGTGNMDLELDVQFFNVTISGDGEVKANGSAKNQKYVVSGVGYLQCFNLIGENVDVDISGAAGAEVNASNVLSVIISGSGNIYYKGSPSITTDISGTGNIIDAN